MEAAKSNLIRPFILDPFSSLTLHEFVWYICSPHTPWLFACLSVGRSHEPKTQTQLHSIWSIALKEAHESRVIRKIVIQSHRQSYSVSSRAKGIVQPAQRIFAKSKINQKAGWGRPVARSGCGAARKRKLQPQNLPVNALGLPWFSNLFVLRQKVRTVPGCQNIKQLKILE